VDELMLKCNKHSCLKNGKCTAEKCKARFPKDVVPETVVDPEDGHVTMKHLEPYFNTINPCLTYVTRCNSDVSCLLSGSSVKAVVAYVTDYITKPTLKMYGVFDAMKSVLTKKSTPLSASSGAQDHARKLMTGIVNALTSRLEIGGVFAAAYMMGLPDHFKSHAFIPFYWRQFIKAVDNTIENSDLNLNMIGIGKEERARIVKTGDNDYALYSSCQDYMLRPTEYNNINLHDWTMYSSKSKLTPSQAACVEDFNLGVSSEDFGFVNNFVFLPGHPQRLTHKTSFSRANTPKLPNFITSLPRSDKGDREFYCKTMLMFFKPWRQGNELKCTGLTWSETFNDHIFTKSQHLLMKNFNVRYECYDARDEYSAQEVAKFSGAPSWMTNEVLENIEHTNYMADIAQSVSVDEDISSTIGKRTLARQAEMSVMNTILQQCGWLDSPIDGTPKLPKIWPLIEDNNPTHWSNSLTLEKEDRLKKKILHNQKSESDTSCHSRLSSRKDDVNIVKVVDKSYLHASFVPANGTDTKLINRLVKQFSLNTEQERAFRTIANHACTPGLEQLRMYLGGMGGTGKSRVIEAIIEMFRLREETHRFIVLAPTGSAAALLNGSTYHSVLGLRGSTTNIDESNTANSNETSLSKMMSRLDGVEYIFFDEVSMLSCSKMYAIAEKLSRRSIDPTIPFGGMNMIFAGDFAQLPPVFEGQCYALYSGTVGRRSLKKQGSTINENYQLHSAIGKTLWHQITTVIILRQNMRQSKQSENDAKYRTALENMRYGACTLNDLKFLRTLVARKHSKRKSLARKKFRHVPIIVTRNIQRDKINDMGCHKFAADNNVTLQEFYSEDTWLPPHEYSEDANGKKTRKRRIRYPPPGSLTIDQRLQNHIWSLPHSVTEHKAGCLKLCRGMPVMIKLNVATECCVTNGAEATVVGWDSHQNACNKQVLDILFVELKDPPSSIHLPGLPKNVVPIMPCKTPIKCMLGDDKLIYIRRQQVPILPNFAMTDYCSQGRTRKYNVVQLESGSNTLSSVYTALSRSSSAENTVILQDFDLPELTSGVSGYLRQEYRELEILDHISKLRFEGNLPPSLTGTYRNELIQQYRTQFGKGCIPEHVHTSMHWTESTEWHEHTKPVQFNTTTMPCSEPLGFDDAITPNGRLKRKRDISDDTYRGAKKQNCNKQNTTTDLSTPPQWEQSESMLAPQKATISNTSYQPCGFMWDVDNWSCAYDSVLFVLANLWKEATDLQRNNFMNVNCTLDTLAPILDDATSAQPTTSYTQLRNFCRHILHQNKPEIFQYGQTLVSVADVVSNLFCLESRKPVVKFHLHCHNCKQHQYRLIHSVPIHHNHLYWNNSEVVTYPKSISTLLQKVLKGPINRSCQICGEDMTLSMERSQDTPPLLVFDLSGVDSLPQINQTLHLSSAAHKKTRYLLKGVIYYKNNHFTSTYITTDKHRWWNDDISTGNLAVPAESSDLLVERGGIASLVIYAKEK
jgi:hypothetical protein